MARPFIILGKYRRHLLFLMGWAFCVIAGASAAPDVTGGGERIALVIGNSAYPGAAALRNPANDAADMAGKLRKLGFEVILKTDIPQKQMLRTLTDFGDKITKGSEALFFYAGHGMQVRGKNYLIPVDAEIRTESSVSSEAVDVDQLLDKLAPARLSIVILDACRNNPFERRFRGGGQGLAQINAPSGTLIAYATAPGKVASDGDGRNGLYTQELLRAMDVDGIKIEDVFKRVRANVLNKSGEAQIPWESSSLTGDFHFTTGDPANVRPQLAVADSETAFWNEVKAGNSREYIEAYVKQYPQGRYLAFVPLELKKLEERERQERLQHEQKSRNKDKAENGKTAYSSNLAANSSERYASQASATKQQARDETYRTENSSTPTGDQFKDCPECPTMVILPAGRFDMGGTEADEKPVHPVEITGFALGKTHITRGQFAAFVSATSYDPGARCWTFEGGKFEERSGRDWRNPGFSQTDDHPAVCINWNDAKAYLDWLSKKTGKNYRLPSEAEQEYATRGGTTTARFWGDDPDLACEHANVMDTTGKQYVRGVNWKIHNCTDGHAHTAPVGSYKPNGYGLHDMIGNAWQWTEDCWHENYNGAPVDGTAWVTECNGGDRRVLRGGSWHNDPQFARAAIRLRYFSPHRANSDFGFRPALSLTPDVGVTARPK